MSFKSKAVSLVVLVLSLVWLNGLRAQTFQVVPLPSATPTSPGSSAPPASSPTPASPVGSAQSFGMPPGFSSTPTPSAQPGQMPSNVQIPPALLSNPAVQAQLGTLSGQSLPSTPSIPTTPSQAAPSSQPFTLQVAQPTATTQLTEPLSAFEEFVSGKTPSTISFDIKQFGYDLFLTPGTPGAPPQPVSLSGQAPVSSTYVVGPGDEIRVSVWGSIEATWNVVVDRDGSITLPKVGVIGVTGMSFQEMRDFLQKELSKYYNDFQLNVSMGQLKSIRVYLVGNARTPGAYNISALSTLINALITAGGPSKSGSMRNIQLKRNGETVANVDLYDFLIRGDKSKDVRLQSEDVIFIPPIGPVVGIAGNVERPAIYEMKGSLRLSEAINMAGGAVAAAYLQRVQVERVFQRQSKMLLDLNLQGIKGKEDITLQDGDIVKVFPVAPQVTNKIVLQGNVKRPGEYEWKHGMRIRDILPSYEMFLPDTMFESAVIVRKIPPDYHEEYKSFSPREMLSNPHGESNLLLQPFDTVKILNKWDVMEREKVRITGAVNKPDEYQFNANMKLSDLIKLAGGLKKNAYTRTAELTRVTPTDEGPKTEQIYVHPMEALAGNPEDDLELKQDDYVFIRTVPDWNLYRKVSVTGEVKFPGEYALSKGERLSSLLERAGGFTDKAYLRGTVFTRQSVKELQQKQFKEMANRLERELAATSSAETSSFMDEDEAKALLLQNRQKAAFVQSLKGVEAKGRMVVHIDDPRALKNTPFDITLEEGDTLAIPSNPGSVLVIGAVQNQTSFVYEPKQNHSFYINRSGGYSASADKGKVYILKTDGTAMQPGKGLFWDSASNSWQSGGANSIEPGDTIVVPDDLDQINWLRETKDFTQILYQIAVGAGVVLRAF